MAPPNLNVRFDTQDPAPRTHAPASSSDYTELMTAPPEPGHRAKLLKSCKQVTRIIPASQVANRAYAQDVTGFLRDRRVVDWDDDGIDYVARPMRDTHQNIPRLVALGIKDAFAKISTGQVQRLTSVLRARSEDRSMWKNHQATLSVDVLNAMFPAYEAGPALSAGLTALKPPPPPAPSSDGTATLSAPITAPSNLVPTRLPVRSAPLSSVQELEGTPAGAEAPAERSQPW